MKTVHVVCAIIQRDGEIFATQRGYGEFKDWWEFPGGKVEEGESEPEALVREIKEELNADIAVGPYLCQAEYDYDTFHLSMACYLCSLENGHIDLLEHEDAKWLDAQTIDSVRWLPADVIVVEAIKDAVFVD